MQQIDHTKNIIELRDISFSYSSDEKLELNAITLEIHKGDYLGIIGPNGGGKSTLLKVMLGLLKPNAGNVFLFGTELQKFKDWSRIGYVAQNVTHIDKNFPMTVKEVVSMGRIAKRGLFHFLQANDYEKVFMALEKVDMIQFKDRLIGDLSGGQQQRVFIARALAGEPEVIVLDEPTIGIDVKTQEQFYTLLQKLNKQFNLTLVLVSHELDVVAHEATEIAYINCSLVYHGTPKQFMKSGYFEKLYGKGYTHHA